MPDFLMQYAANPLTLAVAIIVFSWLWEDGALIGGALLAAEGSLPPLMAMAAVYLGISSGDLGLYYLGRAARRWRALRLRLLSNLHYRRLSRRFRQKTFSNIMLIRFIPGLRTAGFTVCGLWQVPLKRFASAMALAGILWVSLLFTLIYQLGSSAWLEDSPWKWSLGLIALVLLVFNNTFAARGSRALSS